MSVVADPTNCRPEPERGRRRGETIIAMRARHTSPALIRSTYGHLIGTIGKWAAEAAASLPPLKA